MTGRKCVVFLVVLKFLCSLTRGDTEVSCVFMENCILPCSFKSSTDVVIHWIQLTAGDLYVHSYYYNQDQVTSQGHGYRKRTSLFKDQISRGNASLQLTGVEVQDQGRYKCYTTTIRGNKESFIDLKVDAPVNKVDIQQVENRITCSSEGIYPEPELTWSTNPPSIETFKTTTTVQQTEQQLYNISSSLILSDDVTDVVYSCTVSTRRNRRRVTLFKQTSITGSDTETTTTICTSLNMPFSGLVWRFNHSQIILIRTMADAPYNISEEWRQHVKHVSESGSLTLQDLSSNQEGIYTCELSNDEETHKSNTVLYFMRTEKGNSNVSRDITGVVVPVISALAAAAVLAGLALYHKKKGEQQENNETNTEAELKTELHEDVDESAPLQNDGFPPDTHSPQELELFNKDHNNEDT